MANHALAAALVTEALDSFEKLEAVLFLHRGGPSSVDVIAQGVGVPEDRVAEALTELVRDDVVARSQAGYQLPSSGRWTAHVQQLVELHRDDRMQVVTLMSNAAMERMRSRASRAFADAFVIGSRAKKGDRDG